MVYVAKVAEQLHLMWHACVEVRRDAATPPSYIFHKSHKRRLFSTPLSVHVLGRHYSEALLMITGRDPVRRGAGNPRKRRVVALALEVLNSNVELLSSSVGGGGAGGLDLSEGHTVWARGWPRQPHGLVRKKRGEGVSVFPI